MTYDNYCILDGRAVPVPPSLESITTTTAGQRAILLAWAALAAAGRGLAWLMVLSLVLAGLDGLLPRVAPAAPAAVLETPAPAAVAPMAHPWALAIEMAAPATVKALRAMAKAHGLTDWRKASRPQLVAGLYAIA